MPRVRPYDFKAVHSLRSPLAAKAALRSTLAVQALGADRLDLAALQ